MSADIHQKGTVVLGTVEGDLHDIGKNLVGMMLGSNGFNVVDVGVDVPADSFASAAKESNADIVGMSGWRCSERPTGPEVEGGVGRYGVRERSQEVARISYFETLYIKGSGFVVPILLF